MSTYSWNTSDGDWGTAGNWEPTNGPPNSTTATAVIAAGGSYTVTISNEQVVANTVTLNASGAILEIDPNGTLVLGGSAPTFLLDAGVLDLSGTIVGGTIKLAGGTAILENNAELSGVTWRGALTLGVGNALYITNGLTVQTATGGSPGYIDATQGDDTLFVLDSETLNKATLDFGSNGGDRLYNYDQENAGDTLTLGTGFTLAVSGNSTYGDDSLYNQYADDTIVNDGTLDITGGALAVQNGTFTNAGKVFISNAVADFSSPTFSNSGSIVIESGGIAVLGNDPTNTGSIIVEAGGTLDLTGYVTLSELESAGHITNNGGTLQIDGTLDLGGGTLDAGPTGLFSDVILNGTLADGTVTFTGGTVTLNNPELYGITWQGTLALGPYSHLFIANGLTVETATGGSPGYIDFTAGNDTLYVQDSETLNKLTLDFGSYGGDTLFNFDPYDAGNTLTLGSSFTLAVSGGYDYLQSDQDDDTIVNDGTLDITGGELAVQNGTFTNAGKVFISNAVADFSSPTFSNSGSIVIESGGIAVLGNDPTNTGSIIVEAGGVLVLGDDPANTGSITIEAGGTLDLTGYVTLAELQSHLTNNGTLQIDGTLDLGGGTLDAGPTGLFSDVILNGTLADGTVTFTGGTVTLNNPELYGITWQGTLALGPYSHLFIANGLTVETATGGSPGYIDFTAGNDTLYVLDSETLNKLTLDFGSYGGDTLFNFDPYDAGNTLTLGSSFTLAVSGGYDYLQSDQDDDTIVNDGTLDITGGELAVQNGTFTNAGKVFISNAVADFSSPTFSNSGSIVIESGGIAVLGNDPTNTGSIIVEAGGILDLTGYVTLFGLESAGHITNNGGTLQVDGTLDLGGSTIAVAPTGLFSDFTLNGTLADGTVKFTGGSVTLNNPELYGITWQGTLALGFEAALYIANGLTVETATGARPGYIDATAGDDTLYVLDSETLNNLTLDFGANGSDTLYNYDRYNTGNTLTLGSGFTLAVSGGYDTLISAQDDDTIVNDGTFDITGGELVGQNGTFTNAGKIGIDNAEADFSGTTFTNTSSIDIGSGGILVVGTGFDNTGRITIEAGGTLDLTGSVSLSQLLDDPGQIINDGGTVQVDGTLDLGGGTFDVAATGPTSNVVLNYDGTLANGTVGLDGGSFAFVSINNDNPYYSPVLYDVTWKGTLALGFDSALSIVNGLAVQTATGGSPGYIDATAGDDALYVWDSETLIKTTLDFGSNGGDTLNNYDPGNAGDTLTLGAGFTLAVSETSSYGDDDLINLYSTDTIVSAGTIDITGGELDVSGGVFRNTGTADITDGTFDVANARFTNTGNIVIGADALLITASGAVSTGNITISGGTLDLPATSSMSVHFGAGDGTLQIGTANGYTGTIYNFLQGPTIDLVNLAYHNDGTATLKAGNTLQVVEGSTTVDLRLDPTVNYNGLVFDTAPDGTAVTVVCFLAGTRIATEDGETMVEDLRIGDKVRTLGGEHRRVTWIGTGKHLATPGRRDASTPVIIRRSAIADRVPYFDLRVTKAHSLYFDGVLIPVEFLVNHRTILWDDRAREVTLYHVELETHDILLANGAPAESYRDDGNRWLFTNANSGWHLPPQEPCAPVVTGGPIVDTVWQRLLERAGARPGLPLTEEPDLHLTLDGERIDGEPIVRGAWMFRLSRVPDASSDDAVRIVSRAAAPQELGLARDPRMLGIALRRVAIDEGSAYRIIEADDDRLVEGTYAYEPELGIRWTDGSAVLPGNLFDGFTGPVDVVVHVAQTAHYVDEGAVRGAA